VRRLAGAWREKHAGAGAAQVSASIRASEHLVSVCSAAAGWAAALGTRKTEEREETDVRLR